MRCHRTHNVRELDSVVRGALLAGRERLGMADLPDRIGRVRHGRQGVASKVVADPRARVEAALRRHRGNVRQASRDLGMARGHLYRLLGRWDLSPDSFRAGTRVAPRRGA
jgi:transcriptional regulator of acetoin/glycerol metabolism